MIDTGERFCYDEQEEGRCLRQRVRCGRWYQIKCTKERLP